MRALACLLTAALFGSGCFLPLSTAAPQPARTVGRGKFGMTDYVEFPSVNLTSTEAPTSGAGPRGGAEVISPSLTGVGQVSYGLTDKLDLELGVEAMLYLFFLPLPTGVHAGARYQFLDTALFKGAAAARVGYSTFSATFSGQEHKISSVNGMVSGVLQLTALPVLHPSLAISVFPAHVSYSAAGVGSGQMMALAGSAHLNMPLDFGLVEVGPFAGVALYTSPRLPAPRLAPQFGISFALRPGKADQTPAQQARERSGKGAESPPEAAPPRSQPDSEAEEGATPPADEAPVIL